MKYSFLGLIVLFSVALFSFVNSSNTEGNYTLEKITNFEMFDQAIESGETVLSQLSEETLLDFKKSLKFAKNSGELATAKYRKVQEELSGEDYNKVWLLFSINGDTDYKDYKCVSSNNCKKESDYICLSGCSGATGFLEFEN